MIHKVKTIVEREVTLLKAEMGVRYWEDGTVNGEPDDEDNPKMPLADKGVWRLLIDLTTGEILEWPQGVTASAHYKVCDDGVYSLIDRTGATVIKKDGYVPSMMSPKDRGYGDYVIMDIGADGKIADWRADLSYFDDDE